MPLETRIQIGDGLAVICNLSISLDTVTAPELERQLAPVLAQPVKDIVFNLAELTFISSAGLRVLSNTRKTLLERGGQASFVHLQPQIQEVFEIIRALAGVEIFKNTDKLDQYLAAKQRGHQRDQPPR
jgi:anti-sigma B factor antagonist